MFSLLTMVVPHNKMLYSGKGLKTAWSRWALCVGQVSSLYISVQRQDPLTVTSCSPLIVLLSSFCLVLLLILTPLSSFWHSFYCSKFLFFSLFLPPIVFLHFSLANCPWTVQIKSTKCCTYLKWARHNSQSPTPTAFDITLVTSCIGGLSGINAVVSSNTLIKFSCTSRYLQPPQKLSDCILQLCFEKLIITRLHRPCPPIW